MLRAVSALGARPMGRPPAPFLLPARCRKTRHDPPAKSKVGRVSTPPAVDPAEFFVLTERYRQYRQTVRALRLEFVSEVRKKMHEARTGVLAERKAREDAAEHRELMAWNQAENQRLRELRMARLRQEAREQERRQAEEEARQVREAQAWAQLKEREVLQLQEEAKNFITRENLEARVEEALDSPKSYNWAITREGLVVRPQHKGS
ncbi:small ribosomal subunit protein mS26 [Physeter macrocephalus]|uniref:Small ribosomal subunit protein mS26 n=1 Tax=Physeter macrocephalus TaxID=9755 RepID=A0A2Y9FN56_PHYMC|nr:28S ribosomal protein S26, mitochondrial [Physeter catodon]XP_028355339.1 28S ribosomal protein S26, mitochondrial [Physeter catodon]|eukprot:XP_007127199.1 28S ribosomal protein S26, mitochondrial [Physeter catodon]